MNRPILDRNISVTDFKDYYWLKEELTAFCKLMGISTAGNKQELTHKIIAYLQTGNIVYTVAQKPISKFNWNTAQITLETVITDNYKNSENVRLFMQQQIGSHFRFNTEFMKWTKQQVGKTMQDAIEEWNRIYEQKKNKVYKATIPSQFEYNTYIRDFLANNADKTLTEAIKYWKLKRQQRGNNTYSKDDLLLTE